MAKIIVAHKNTEETEIDLGLLKNDKVAWMVLLKDDGSLQHFFPNRETTIIIDNSKEITKMRNESYNNAKRIIDECMIEELQMILRELWDGNAQKWIDNVDLHDTIGHEFIMEYGFTRNQLRWIRHMIHILQGNNSYCDGCKYISWIFDNDTKDKIGGACGHPIVLKRMSNRTTFTGIPYNKPEWCAGKIDPLSDMEKD